MAITTICGAKKKRLRFIFINFYIQDYYHLTQQLVKLIFSLENTAIKLKSYAHVISKLSGK